LLVTEDLCEEFAQSRGGRILSAAQGHLGLGLLHGPCRDEAPLTVIGVKQIGWCPAVDVGR